MPTGKVKLPRTPTEGAVELPGACGPGLPADTSKQDDGATDGEPRRSLRLREKAKQVEADQSVYVGDIVSVVNIFHIVLSVLC